MDLKEAEIINLSGDTGSNIMHKIFFIHGMGNYQTGWAKEVIKQLGDQYNEYGIFNRRGSFDSRFQCIEISYNSFFEKYLTEWKTHSQQLSAWGELAVAINNPLIARMTKIAGNGPSDSFLTTHIGDVLLYMLTNIREQVKASVATQITQELKPGAFDGWSIISHSLGTRVMTDTLQMLYTEPRDQFRQTCGKAKLITTIANVNYLLQKIGNESGDIYRNAVFPGKKGTCYQWLNAGHELDPFLWAWPFVPPANQGSSPEWKSAIEHGLYKDVRLTARDITGENPHDLGHYLRHPDVHQAIFQALEDADGPSIFSPAELVRERQDYYNDTLPEDALKKIRDRLEALKQKDYSTFALLLDVWEKYGDEDN